VTINVAIDIKQVATAAPEEGAAARRLGGMARSTGRALIGMAILFVLWWIGGWLVASNPATSNFADFAPLPTL
jgi:NitT/TauT family transport system permease protein